MARGRARLVGWVLSRLAWIVPRSERETWRLEWQAELAYLAKSNRSSALADGRHLLAAFHHAVWLRADGLSLGTLAPRRPASARGGPGRQPVFSLAVLLTVALGVGAGTAIHGAARAVFWRPLPYLEPDRVVVIDTRAKDEPAGAPVGNVAAANFDRWRHGATTLADLGAFKLAGGTLTGEGPAEQLVDAAVTSGFFRVLGVAPIHGRTFTAGDDAPGGPSEAVLGFDLWRRRFDADPGVVGRTILLAGTPRLVVGVMPEGFRYPLNVDLWVTLRMTAEDLSQDRGIRHLGAIGRLADDATIDTAARQLSAVIATATEPRLGQAPTEATLATLRESMVGERRAAMRVLVAAVTLAWLIGCANIASLTLGRAADRERDLRVRAALGASRSRLVRSVLVEHGILAGLGGICALGLAHAALGMLAALPSGVPYLDQARLDGRTALFGVALTAATVVLSAAWPTWRAGRADRPLAPGHASPRTTPGVQATRWRGGLVAAELAMTVALLVGAGLIARSFLAMTAVDLGFAPDVVQAYDVSISTRAYSDGDRQRAFFDDLFARLRATPDVESVAGTFGLPLENFDRRYAVRDRDGVPVTPGATGGPAVQLRNVTPDYFRTLGIPVLAGREFTADDRRGTERVAIVNAAAARLLWPDGPAIGHHLVVERGEGDTRGGTVVGVVGDVREFGPSQPVPPTLYVTPGQVAIDVLTIIVRPRGEGNGIDRAVRDAVTGLDLDVPVTNRRTMAALATAATFDQRASLQVLAFFAFTAISLAAIGVYGVVALDVAARRRELGVRIALGASRSQLIGAVSGRAATLAGVGIVAGLGLAAAGSRAMTNLLFDVSPVDMSTYALAAALTMTITIAAAGLPARRAARLDPTVVLRND
ncbi:MAG: ABC transporter permease [Vicinamibacterales bacterium]